MGVIGTDLKFAKSVSSIYALNQLCYLLPGSPQVLELVGAAALSHSVINLSLVCASLALISALRFAMIVYPT